MKLGICRDSRLKDLLTMLAVSVAARSVKLVKHHRVVMSS